MLLETLMEDGLALGNGIMRKKLVVAIQQILGRLDVLLMLSNGGMEMKEAAHTLLQSQKNGWTRLLIGQMYSVQIQNLKN